MQPHISKVRSSVSCFVVVCALGSACNSTTGRAGPSAQASRAADAARLTAGLHKRLVDEAERDYVLGDYRPSIPVPAGTLDHGIAVTDLHAWARKMTRITPSTPGADEFVGLIFTDKKYKKLGMGRNENYVLKLPTAGKTIYVMVPSDLNIQMSLLDYDSTSTFNHSPHDPPQVVHEVTATNLVAGNRVESMAIGGCVDGPCPSGHCGIGSSGAEFTYNLYTQLKAESRRP